MCGTNKGAASSSASAVAVPENGHIYAGETIGVNDFFIDDRNEVVFVSETEDENGPFWNLQLIAKSNVDRLFGTFVETDENSDYIDIYVNVGVDMMFLIKPELDVIYCGADTIYGTRQLNEEEQLAILYIVQKYAATLLSRAAAEKTLPALIKKQQSC